MRRCSPVWQILALTVSMVSEGSISISTMHCWVFFLAPPLGDMLPLLLAFCAPFIVQICVRSRVLKSSFFLNRHPRNRGDRIESNPGLLLGQHLFLLSSESNVFYSPM